MRRVHQRTTHGGEKTYAIVGGPQGRLTVDGEKVQSFASNLTLPVGAGMTIDDVAAQVGH